MKEILKKIWLQIEQESFLYIRMPHGEVPYDYWQRFLELLDQEGYSVVRKESDDVKTN